MTHPTHPPGAAFDARVHANQHAITSEISSVTAITATSLPGAITRQPDMSRSTLAAAEFAAPDAALAPTPGLDASPPILPQRRLAAGEFGDW